MNDIIFTEKPDTIHGRLLESVHLSGYTMERACIGLEWLLDDDRWKTVGKGYENINDFLTTINLSQFKIAVDQRKKLAKRLEDMQATQRAAAAALGVGQATIQRDLNSDSFESKKKNNSLWDNNEKKEVDSFESPSILTASPQDVIKPLEKIAKGAEKKTERNEKIESLRGITAGSPAGPFDVVVIDPPWPYGREYDPEGSRVANPYPEMSIEKITGIELPVKKDCALWLWTTHAFLHDALHIMKEWGFEYKATGVWDKEKMGMGAWLRMQCEFFLLGIKGKPLLNTGSQRDILREPRREHSRKPDSFYKMVDDMCPGGKVDWFARLPREGWTVYGNEVI